MYKMVPSITRLVKLEVRASVYKGNYWNVVAEIEARTREMLWLLGIFIINVQSNDDVVAETGSG